MRKKLFITAAIIVLLLLSFWGFLEYRQYSSYKTPIHNTAETILKINVDAFIKTFIKEYGFNFREKIKSPAKKDTVISGNAGIYIPGNIFIYTVSNRKNNTFFCTLPLTNAVDFKNFASEKMGILFDKSNEGISGDNKLTILYSAKYAAIAWSNDREEVKSVLLDLINKQNLLPKSDSLILRLKKNRDHLVLAKKYFSASAKIDGNQVIIQSTIQSSDAITASSGSQLHQKMFNGNFGFLRIGIKPQRSMFAESYSVKDVTLQTDSLLKYFDGYFSLAVGKPIPQTDTIVTYEYDDNFEKVEKKTARIVQVPKIEMSLKVLPGFLDYLQQQQVVLPTGMLNRELFPLYKVSVIQQQPLLLFTTDENTDTKFEGETAAFMMQSVIDFNKIQSLFDSSSVKQYFEGFDQLQFNGEKIGNHTIEIHGNIRFKGSVLKNLQQLIETYNKQNQNSSKE